MKFREFAAFSQGSKYAEKNWNCQDSADKMEFGKVQAVAVADGHGGSNYFRSEFGSKLAIQVLFEQIKIWCDDLKEGERFGDTGIKNLKYTFVQKWREAVKKDWYERLQGKSLGEGEVRYESVSEKYIERYNSTDPKVLEKYLYVAYGTTLICAVSIGTQVLILQIGDGTCVLLQRDGEFCVPVPADENNVLNRTTSLCDEDAVLKIRHAVINCDKNSPNAPVAIFLSTDGLDDCFPYYQNEEHLFKLYADVILDNIVKRGWLFFLTENEIKNELLPGLSKRASQDDISLAYLIDSNPANLKETFAKIDSRYKTLDTSLTPAHAPNVTLTQPATPPVKFTPPENISTAEKIVKSWSPPKVTKTSETKTVTAFSPPKISKPTETKISPAFTQNISPSKISTSNISAPTFSPVLTSTGTTTKQVTELQLPTFFKNSTPLVQDKPPQTLFRRNEVTISAPVQIPVQVTDTAVAKTVTPVKPAKPTFTPTQFEKYEGD